MYKYMYKSKYTYKHKCKYKCTNKINNNASQGAGAMRWPVLGTVLRFVVSVGGASYCVLYLDMELQAIFYAGALGMGLYAIFIATAIFKGAWRR